MPIHDEKRCNYAVTVKYAGKLPIVARAIHQIFSLNDTQSPQANWKRRHPNPSEGTPPPLLSPTRWSASPGEFGGRL